MTRRRREAAVAGASTRAVAYIRVSTADQAEEGHSLAAQRAKLEACAALDGLEVIAWEVDAGESAGSLDRPALARALGHLDRGRADALLVVKLDRLTRSVRDLAELLERYFGPGARRPRALLSAEDKVDTRTASGRLVLGLLTQVGQWEREAIGERTAAVREHMRAAGLYGGGSVPFGWRRAGERLEAEPAEQAVLRRAHELRRAGMSLRGIVGTLRSAGARVRGGAPPSLGHVHRMLDQEVTAGDTPYRDPISVSGFR